VADLVSDCREAAAGVVGVGCLATERVLQLRDAVGAVVAQGDHAPDAIGDGRELPRGVRERNLVTGRLMDATQHAGSRELVLDLIPECECEGRVDVLEEPFVIVRRECVRAIYITRERVTTAVYLPNLELT